MKKGEIERRHKVCSFCGVQFCDISRRPDSGTCCSKKCSYAKMSETRKANGTYNVTQEQTKKRVDTIRKKYGSFAACQKESSRQKNSEGLSERWKSGRMKEKSQKTCLAKYGVTHWTKTATGRAFASSLHTGRPVSQETRKKMSIAATKRIQKVNTHSSGNGGFREDLGCYFRSNWEANYARILNLQGKSWEYEAKSFQLSEGTYTPDFQIQGVEGFIEIKGRVESEEAMRKVDLFMAEYPEIPVSLIGPDEYDQLRKEYKHKIAWEGR